MVTTAQVQTAPGVLKRIQDSAFVERVYTSLHQGIQGLIYRVSPVVAAQRRYQLKMGRRLRLENPLTFDEKLFWLMLFWHHPLKAQCADKLGMRAHAENLGYGHLLVDLLGVYTRVSDIDFPALPDRFVLKCSHGCGFNILCPDKRALEEQAVRRRLRAWMRRDYAKIHGESQYEGLVPRILCERFLDDGSGGPPADFKLHCFHGKVYFTTVCTGRDLDGQGAAYDHYDREWLHQLPYSKFGSHPDRWRARPDCYQDMVQAAEALSAPFPYVRMDFYSIAGRPLLGEMTFTPSGCIDIGYTDEAQDGLGALIHLPEPLARWAGAAGAAAPTSAGAPGR